MVASREDERFQNGYEQRCEAKYRNYPSTILDSSHHSFQLLVGGPNILTKREG